MSVSFGGDWPMVTVPTGVLRSWARRPQSKVVRLAVLIAVLIVVVSAESTALSAQAERVTRFESDVSVQHDATLAITERITVVATGDVIRHGIYRDISGLNGRLPVLTVESVSLDGHPEPYRIQNSAGARRIYVGREDATVAPGQHSYELRYSLQGELQRDGSYDRLYWNVTGNNWTLPIEAVEARVAVPTSTHLDAIAYTGPTGATGSDYSETEVRPGEIVFASTRTFMPGSGMTIDVRWPHSVAPSLSQRLIVYTADPALRICSLALLVVIAWWLIGGLRAPEHVHVADGSILSAPPDNLSPTALRFICEGILDNKAFTAAVVDLAGRGALRIEQLEDDYELSATNVHVTDLPPEERQLVKALFGASHSLRVKRDTRRVARALKSFASEVNSRYAKLLSAPPALTWARWALSAAAVAYALLAQSDRLSRAEALIALIVLFASVLLLRNALQSFHWSTSIAEVMPGTPAALIPLTMAALTTFVIVGIGTAAGTPCAVLTAAHVLVNLAGEYWLKFRTGEAAQIAADAGRFRNFLKQNAGITHEGVFNKWAAYALALDVEEQWFSAFASGISDAVPARPSWYSGDSFEDFYVRSSTFEKNLLHKSGHSRTASAGAAGLSVVVVAEAAAEAEDLAEARLVAVLAVQGAEAGRHRVSRTVAMWLNALE